MARGELQPLRQERISPVSGTLGWQSLPPGWRRLCGSVPEVGVGIEWHDFHLSACFDWSRAFHPGSLELCLNLAGQGVVRCGGSALAFEPMTAGFYLPGRRGMRASREAGQRHCFVTIEFTPRFLRGYLSSCDGALHPLVEGFVRGRPSRAGLGVIHRLTASQERRVTHLAHPPVAQAARALWYQSQVLELMAEFFFERTGQDELFCDRQKRVARERVDRVVGLLQERLSEPPSLEEIGRAVGCSPFYLSRTFSQQTGLTIPQYLRKLRMEQAAELLTSGRYNVTEAALEVGYSSLSHFSLAFCQTMGCCPTLYPLRSPGRGSGASHEAGGGGDPAAAKA